MNRNRMYIVLTLLCVILMFVACQNGSELENAQEGIPTDIPTQTVTKAPTATPTKVPTTTPTPSPEPTKAPLVFDDDFPSLAQTYQDYFSIGVGVCVPDVSNVLKSEVIVKQFNSLTCGNEMKADYVLDHEATLKEGTEECPVLNFKNADKLLAFCFENGIPMRAHTLIWHSQTPRWFFTEGYSDAADAPFVSKEIMLKRMENYIRMEMEYINTTYPGVVYAWDVINEAVEFNGGVNGYRAKGSYYYQVIGVDFFEKAFEFARKYAAPEQKLFYNDYNTHETEKMNKIIEILKPLVDKGLVDGVGLQSHLGLTAPSIGVIRTSIRQYNTLGIEIQITELDVDAQKNTESTQLTLAKRYKELFTMLKEMKDEGVNLTNVTFWGLTDDGSWLNDHTPSWPLLFTKFLEAKPAYWGVMLDESIE